MSEHRWDEPKPESDLPDSSIAREFLLLTYRGNLTPEEEELQEEKILGTAGYGIKLFERFKMQASTHRPRENVEYRTLDIKVFAEPETEFDKTVLRHMEGENLLFCDEYAGLSIQIATEPVGEEGGAKQEDVFALFLIDENGAEIGVYSREHEVRAIVKEGDRDFRFSPSLSSTNYLGELIERLYRCAGPDTPEA